MSRRKKEIEIIDHQRMIRILHDREAATGLAVEAGVFTVHGKTVRYDPALTISVDIPDCTWPETESIPADWDCRRIYRIRLTAPLEARVERIFQMEVCR